MRLNFLLITLILLSSALIGDTEILVHRSTPEEEASSIWRTIRDINFFNKNGYQITLPKAKLIEDLKKKSQKEGLSKKDYLPILRLLKNRIYKTENYQKAYEIIQKTIPQLKTMFEDFCKTPKNWHFKKFQKYRIILTLYGPGGNYNPKNGSISIFTNRNGGFKLYTNPINTLIHEMVHIGIEESLIKKYKIGHQMKERIVDKLVFLKFHKQLPKYRIQDMGDYRIDKYLKTPEGIRNLHKHIQEITRKTS